jgi:hypothetical protein
MKVAKERKAAAAAAERPKPEVKVRFWPYA